jgi:hypothetical protein
MFVDSLITNQCSRFQNLIRLILALTVSLVLLSSVTPVSAQDQSQAPPQDNTQNNGKPKQDVPPEAGGPTGDVGPYAIPKKNPDEAPRRLRRRLRPPKSKACPTIPSRSTCPW